MSLKQHYQERPWGMNHVPDVFHNNAGAKTSLKPT
jgi:hypothetical protein